jgi:hypothetical protein
MPRSNRSAPVGRPKESGEVADISASLSELLYLLDYLLDQITVPTRIYFPSGTFAADVSPAFDAAWNNTGFAAVRNAVNDGRKRGTAAASVTVTGTATNPELMLRAQ